MTEHRSIADRLARSFYGPSIEPNWLACLPRRPWQHRMQRGSSISFAFLVVRHTRDQATAVKDVLAFALVTPLQAQSAPSPCGRDMKTWAANETSTHIHLVICIFFAPLESRLAGTRPITPTEHWSGASPRTGRKSSTVLQQRANSAARAWGTEQSGGCGGDAGIASGAPRGVIPKLPGRFFVANGDAGVQCSLNSFL